jgi:27-O-demethylrifamycin SV methyltransferase
MQVLQAVDNQLHYDSVTDAWMFILGQNLHYGFFETKGESLERATDALIDKMAAMAPIGADTHLLDVGCGIGNPAFHISTHTGCQISAISISRRGIEIGQEKCRLNGLSARVKFYQRDALDNGFPDASFDVVWVMESSHLMRNKAQLIAENYRVLRPGGSMLLCDLILKRDFSLMEIYRFQEELKVLERSFGDAKMETLIFYEDAMRSQGFGDIELLDISREAFPTLEKWRENLDQNRQILAAHFTVEEIDNFSRACEILTEFFTNSLLGYGMVKGVKPA